MTEPVIGRIASERVKRTKDIREGRATMEGVFTGPAFGFIGDCQQEDLSSKSPKRGTKRHTPITRLFGR